MGTFRLNTCAVCGVATFEEEDYCIDCLNDISNDYNEHANNVKEKTRVGFWQGMNIGRIIIISLIVLLILFLMALFHQF